MASLLVAITALAPPAAAYTAEEGALFNRPQGTQTQRWALMRNVDKAIDNAPSGSTILVATYLLDRKTSADKLIAAHNRGVNVRMVVDWDARRTKQSRRLANALTRRPPPPPPPPPPPSPSASPSLSPSPAPSGNVSSRSSTGASPSGAIPSGAIPSGPSASGPSASGASPSGASSSGASASASLGGRPSAAERTVGTSRGSLRAPVAAGYPAAAAAPYTKGDSYIKFCKGSCRGADLNRNMHSKFYAFSSTGGSKWVVMVSSANLNSGGALLGWNDMFTMVGDKTIYDKYQQIHEEMSRDALSPQPYQTVSSGRFESRFFPRPNASMATDPTYQTLSRVRCNGADGGAGRGGRTAVNVSMFWWSGERGRYLAQRLMELDRAGCIVSVVYGAPSKEIAQMLRASALSGGIRLYDSRYDRNGDGFVDMRVHSKYLLINGVYNGDTSAWLTSTGSQNWVAGSLSGGDEVTLDITGRAAYRQYLTNWQTVTSTAARRIG